LGQRCTSLTYQYWYSNPGQSALWLGQRCTSLTKAAFIYYYTILSPFSHWGIANYIPCSTLLTFKYRYGHSDIYSWRTLTVSRHATSTCH
jgi:hypothetical protein